MRPQLLSLDAASACSGQGGHSWLVDPIAATSLYQHALLSDVACQQLLRRMHALPCLNGAWEGVCGCSPHATPPQSRQASPCAVQRAAGLLLLHQACPGMWHQSARGRRANLVPQVHPGVKLLSRPRHVIL